MPSPILRKPIVKRNNPKSPIGRERGKEFDPFDKRSSQDIHLELLKAELKLRHSLSPEERAELLKRLKIYKIIVKKKN